MQIKPGAPLTADAWSGEPATGLLHQLPATRHIAAGGRNRAAQVLDQGTGHQIGTHRRGLLQLHQLAVAVVHEHQTMGLEGLHPLHQPADLIHRERRPPAVAAAALDQHHPGRHGQGGGDPGLIHAAVGQQIQLVVDDAELRQGTLAAAADADHLLKGVVGTTAEGQEAITGAQHPEQGRGNGVGATHKLQAHGGGLRLEHPREHPIEHLSTQITVAIAAHRGEVMHPQPLRRESLQHAIQAGFHSGGSLRHQMGDAGAGGGHLVGSPGAGGEAHGKRWRLGMLTRGGGGGRG